MQMLKINKQNGTHTEKKRTKLWYWRRERNKNRTTAKTLYAYSRDERKEKREKTHNT